MDVRIRHAAVSCLVAPSRGPNARAGKYYRWISRGHAPVGHRRRADDPLAAFGWSSAFWLAFLSLAFAGAADVTSVVLRTSLVQGLTPDNLRGRISAVDFSVVAGAALIGLAIPALLAYRSVPDSPRRSAGWRNSRR